MRNVSEQQPRPGHVVRSVQSLGSSDKRVVAVTIPGETLSPRSPAWMYSPSATPIVEADRIGE
jgi:hypothetical protein